MKRFRTRRGATLPEVIVGSTITVFILGSLVATMFVSSSTWVRGMSRGESETTSQRAVRVMSSQLRQAMAVGVDAGGQGLNYQLPATDGSGAFIAPPTWDGVTRRFQLNGDGTITHIINGNARVIASGVVTVDPRTGNNYQIFTPGIGAVTRSMTLMVASQRFGHRNQIVNSRYRETIFLRNIPEIFQ